MQIKHPSLSLLCLVSALALSLAGCGEKTEEQAEEEFFPEVDIVRVSTGLTREFSLTGEVTPIKRSDFTAEFKATVEKTEVKPGDSVKAGQVLVRLNAPDISQRYNTAAATYGTASMNLEQNKINAQKAVESAQASLKTAEENLQTVLLQNAQREAQAAEVLNSSKVSVNLSVDSAQTEKENAIQAVESTVKSAVNAMSVLLEVSATYADLDYVRENHIGVRDPVLLSAIKSEVGQNATLLSVFSPSYDNALSLLSKTEYTLGRVLTALRNSVTSAKYSQAQLDADIARINGEVASIRSMISRLKSAEKAVNSAMQQSGKSSQAIVSAQAAYDATLADLAAAEQSARRRVEEAKIAFESAKTTAGITELSARSSLTSVTGELMQAKIEQGKLVLRAPFDGVVSDVPVKPGTVVTNGSSVVSVEDNSSYKIVAYLSASEVRRVKIGDSVLSDALSGAVLSAISPSADPVSKKYKVEILSSDSQLKAGEFIKLKFTARQSEAEASGKIFLPVTAVQLTANETFVWTIDDDAADIIEVGKSPVQLGSIEGSMVEILSGIEDGDIVVTDGGRVLEEAGQRVRLSRIEQ